MLCTVIRSHPDRDYCIVEVRHAASSHATSMSQRSLGGGAAPSHHSSGHYDRLATTTGGDRSSSRAPSANSSSWWLDDEDDEEATDDDDEGDAAADVAILRLRDCLMDRLPEVGDEVCCEIQNSGTSEAEGGNKDDKGAVEKGEAEADEADPMADSQSATLRTAVEVPYRSDRRSRRTTAIQSQHNTTVGSSHTGAGGGGSNRQIHFQELSTTPNRIRSPVYTPPPTPPGNATGASSAFGDTTDMDEICSSSFAHTHTNATGGGGSSYHVSSAGGGADDERQFPTGSDGERGPFATGALRFHPPTFEDLYWDSDPPHHHHHRGHLHGTGGGGGNPAALSPIVVVSPSEAIVSSAMRQHRGGPRGQQASSSPSYSHGRTVQWVNDPAHDQRSVTSGGGAAGSNANNDDDNTNIDDDDADGETSLFVRCTVTRLVSRKGFCFLQRQQPQQNPPTPRRAAAPPSPAAAAAKRGLTPRGGRGGGGGESSASTAPPLPASSSSPPPTSSPPSAATERIILHRRSCLGRRLPTQVGQTILVTLERSEKGQLRATQAPETRPATPTPSVTGGGNGCEGGAPSRAAPPPSTTEWPDLRSGYPAELILRCLNNEARLPPALVHHHHYSAAAVAASAASDGGLAASEGGDATTPHHHHTASSRRRGSVSQVSFAEAPPTTTGQGDEGSGGGSAKRRATIDDDLICAVCQDVQRDATLVVDCGHSFCAQCLSDHRAASHQRFSESEAEGDAAVRNNAAKPITVVSCPTCRGPIEGTGRLHQLSHNSVTLVKDERNRRKISQLPICCPRNSAEEAVAGSNGGFTTPRTTTESAGALANAVAEAPPPFQCYWTGRVDEFDAHVAGCKRRWLAERRELFGDAAAAASLTPTTTAAERGGSGGGVLGAFAPPPVAVTVHEGTASTMQVGAPPSEAQQPQRRQRRKKHHRRGGHIA